MTLPTASAVTWSMTATGRFGKQGRIGRPKYSDRQCRRCNMLYSPTGGKQQYCTKCGPKKAKRKSTANSSSLESAPDSIENIPAWLCTADWRTVESAWVALMVEQFATDENRASMALALVEVRKRYRSTSSAMAVQSP